MGCVYRRRPSGAIGAADRRNATYSNSSGLNWISPKSLSPSLISYVNRPFFHETVCLLIIALLMLFDLSLDFSCQTRKVHFPTGRLGISNLPS